jgi:two-component system phosphate regulon sensor histidine kinase PhoR
VPRSHLKLMAALAALVLLVVLLSGVIAERSLRERARAELARSLESQARLVRDLGSDLPFRRENAAALQELALRAAAATGARVTLVAPDGTLVGDSEVPLERLSREASQADRPEIASALAGRTGQASRRSSTLGSELFYLAVPVAGGRGGAARLAVGPPDLSGPVAVLRRQLLVAGAVGLAAALALSAAFSWFTLRPLRELQRTAAAIAGGQLEDRPPLRPRAELKEIADALDRMAEQLKLRLEQVTSEKEQLRAVLNAMVEGVLVVDQDGEILLANDRLRELFDVWSPLEGRTPLEAIRHAQLDAVMAEAGTTDLPVSRAISAGLSAPRTVRVHAVRFPSGSGPRLGSVAVFHDITELTRLEQVRRDFVANASHELRTPLAAIRGFTETLLSNRDLSETEIRSYLEIVDRHARRLGNLVGDLLELSRIESREQRLELATVDVAALAETLLRDSRTRFAEKRLDVGLEVISAAPIWADRQAVEQILVNLLDNAVKYTEPGGRIRIRIEGSEDRVRTSVSDTGLGIPRRDLERIFERFYRVDKARSRALGGTGLGLSIVKHLVQSLGGEISVESELGKGSSFSFSLPRAKHATPRAR